VKFSGRNLLLYFLAWTPYAASYIAVFIYQNRDDFWDAAFIALKNIVPAALLGLLVAALCGKLKWAGERAFWFFPAHLALAVGYSFLWYGAAVIVISISYSFERGVWSPVTFTGYALQWQLFSGVMIYATIASIVYALQIAENLRLEEQRASRAETRAVQIEALLAQSELSALRAQLNPHFLFNTLHSLMALVRYEPLGAEDALEKLAMMLRYVLPEKRENGGNANLVTLGDELRFVENYLSLEKLRLGERLTIEKQIERAALSCLLPAFTLQPLVENAVKHGIAPRARNGRIFIAAKTNEENLEIEISDDGAGADSGDLSKQKGLGLPLVRRQLAIRYGDKAILRIETAINRGFAVHVKVPIETAFFSTSETGQIEHSSVNN
jgi:sensor histidine kinase YesM